MRRRWRRPGAQPLTAPSPSLPPPLPPLRLRGRHAGPALPALRWVGRQVCAPRLSAHSPCGKSRAGTGGGGSGRAERPPEEAAVWSRSSRRPAGRSSGLRGARSPGQGWVPARPGPRPARRAETELRVPRVRRTTGQKEARTDCQEPPGGTSRAAHPEQRPPPEPRLASRLGSWTDWRPPAAGGGGAARGHGRLEGVLARVRPDPSPRRRHSRLSEPGSPSPPRPLREMEQRNRLGAPRYLPPLVLRALLLFVAEGESGNFATAGVSGVLAGAAKASPSWPQRTKRRRKRRGRLHSLQRSRCAATARCGRGWRAANGRGVSGARAQVLRSRTRAPAAARRLVGRRELARPSLALVARPGVGKKREPPPAAPPGLEGSGLQRQPVSAAARQLLDRTWPVPGPREQLRGRKHTAQRAGVAPGLSPTAGHASLFPAPSDIHRSPQRCDRT